MKGIVFINNFFPQTVTLTNGRKVKFTRSKQVFCEPETIEELRFLQANGVPIFEAGEADESDIEQESADREAREREIIENDMTAKPAAQPRPIARPIARTMTRMEAAENARKIAKGLFDAGKINALEYARRDMIARDTIDEIANDVAPIEYEGRLWSGAELTAHLETLKRDALVR